MLFRLRPQCQDFFKAGRGIYEDFCRRLPFYPSDFTDGKWAGPVSVVGVDHSTGAWSQAFPRLAFTLRCTSSADETTKVFPAITTRGSLAYTHPAANSEDSGFIDAPDAFP